jgi:hypothetical protein
VSEENSVAWSTQEPEKPKEELFDRDKKELDLWDSRRYILSEECEVLDEYVKDGVPRIIIENRKISAPRYYSLKEHRMKLIELFPASFSVSDQEPAGLILKSLCGRKDCINTDHQVIHFRRDRLALDSVANAEKGGHGSGWWWTGARDFYDVYGEVAAQRQRERNSNIQDSAVAREVKKKMSHRKSHNAPDRMLEVAIADVCPGMTIKQFKDLERLFQVQMNNVFRSIFIQYGDYARAQREGQHLPGGALPDGRFNRYKNYRGSKS